MMSEQSFELQATWTGGLDGTGRIQAAKLQTAISVPTEFDGPGTGTNPEEMLLGAAATCYIITLGAMLQREGIQSLTLHSHIYVESRPTMKVKSILHCPLICVPSTTVPEKLDKLYQAALRAEKTCMISKALRGNVDVRVQPEIRLMEVM
ncbi:OsmC family protein [Paenibacillus roseipurpureus]|uniref:OsmC family protein n=1 Tax=Paenibacillus roseopurpureus TaxID=2918901 RepID=A0AA96RK01_9BACL|nr:OsmC family protein [Paenibacillus sp. MBLB1832]WNR45918.1 OsmC family protein [Paenibacillus sp. MBLB1832]